MRSLREKIQLKGRAINVEKKTVERETINVVLIASKVLEDPKDNTRWRFKFSSGYNFPNWKLDPSIGVEFFMLNDFYDPNAYDKFRFSLGTKRKLIDSSSISVKYIHQQDVKIENPLSFNILSVNYTYTIKSKK